MFFCFFCFVLFFFNVFCFLWFLFVLFVVFVCFVLFFVWNKLLPLNMFLNKCLSSNVCFSVKKHFFAKFWLKKLSSSAWRLRGSAGRLRATTWHRNDAAPLLHFPSNSKNLAGPALEWARFLNFPDRQDADDLPKPSRNYAARVPRNCAGRCRAQLRGTVPRPATLSPKHIWTSGTLNAIQSCLLLEKQTFENHGCMLTEVHGPAHGWSPKKQTTNPPKQREHEQASPKTSGFTCSRRKKKANFGMLEQSCVRYL